MHRHCKIRCLTASLCSLAGMARPECRLFWRKAYTLQDNSMSQLTSAALQGWRKLKYIRAHLCSPAGMARPATVCPATTSSAGAAGGLPPAASALEGTAPAAPAAWGAGGVCCCPGCCLPGAEAAAAAAAGATTTPPPDAVPAGARAAVDSSADWCSARRGTPSDSLAVL